ncbi:hypothetical protein JNUCC83_12435 (plasmid) [Vagococcus sp. JNUCC 83]
MFNITGNIKKSINDLEDSWKQTKPQLKNQMLEENKDNPLGVMRAIKELDDIQQRLTNLLSDTFSEAERVKEMYQFAQAVKESHEYQQSKRKKK